MESDTRPGKWLGTAPDGAPEDLWPWLALAAIGLLLLVVGRRVWRRRGAMRECRWRRTAGGSGALHKWSCRSCGAEAFTSDGRRPKECKRALRGTL